MLDRTRCIVERRIGTDPVDPNTTFQEGDILHWSSVGWRKSASTGANVIRGIAGVNRIYAPMMRVVIQEPIIFTEAGQTVNLKHANLLSNSERVTSSDGLTVYTKTTDYTINYTNGQITHVQGGNIPLDTEILVSYTYQMTLEEQEQEVGMPISNTYDETLGSNQTVVIQGNCVIYTLRYDSSRGYAINDALYDNGDGRLTNNSSVGGPVLGRVKKVPTASDPYLGAELHIM